MELTSVPSRPYRGLAGPSLSAMGGGGVWLVFVSQSPTIAAQTVTRWPGPYLFAFAFAFAYRWGIIWYVRYHTHGGGGGAYIYICMIVGIVGGRLRLAPAVGWQCSIGAYFSFFLARLRPDRLACVG